MFYTKQMARLPALVSALHSTDGRERPTLDLIARSVREAGFIATTKRGSGAAEMGVKDAVNLLIGANAVQSPVLAGAAVRQYQTFKQSPHGRHARGTVFSALAAAETLIEALAILVEQAGALDEILVASVEATYGRPYNPATDFVLKPSLMVTFAASCVDITYQDKEALLWRFQPDADLLMDGFYTVSNDGPGRRVTTTVLFPAFLALNASLFGAARVLHLEHATVQ